MVCHNRGFSKAYYTTYKYNIGPYACADGVWYIGNNYDGYLFAEMLADAASKSFLYSMSLKVTKKARATDDGFIANLVLSLLLWGAIIIGRDELAVLVGNDGLGIPLAVMGAMIPLSAFSSVQMACIDGTLTLSFF